MSSFTCVVLYSGVSRACSSIKAYPEVLELAIRTLNSRWYKFLPLCATVLLSSESAYYVLQPQPSALYLNGLLLSRVRWNPQFTNG